MNPTIKLPAEYQKKKCEKHGPFVSKHWVLGPDEFRGPKEWWSDCHQCLERDEKCEKHGIFVSKHENAGEVWERWSDCPRCEAEKWAERERQYRDRLNREMRASFLARLIQEAAIPPLFYSKTLADYKPTTEGERRALSVAKNYVEAFPDHLAAGRCLVFCGSPGTGKTHLACAIAKSLAENGRRTRYMTVVQLIRLLRSTWRTDAPETTDMVLQSLRQLDLLVLDEVGVQFGTDAERRQLEEVVDQRYSHRKPTLVVTNFPSDELKRCLGDRIVDRLRDSSGKVVIFDWPSRRGNIEFEAERNCFEGPVDTSGLYERTMRDLAEDSDT